MSKLSNLDIEEIFRQGAQKIIDARKRSKLIHATNDIKASGNEVEPCGTRLFTKQNAK